MASKDKVVNKAQGLWSLELLWVAFVGLLNALLHLLQVRHNGRHHLLDLNTQVWGVYQREPGAEREKERECRTSPSVVTSPLCSPPLKIFLCHLVVAAARGQLVLVHVEGDVPLELLGLLFALAPAAWHRRRGARSGREMRADTTASGRQRPCRAGPVLPPDLPSLRSCGRPRSPRSRP